MYVAHPPAVAQSPPPGIAVVAVQEQCYAGRGEKDRERENVMEKERLSILDKFPHEQKGPVQQYQSCNS